MLDPSEIDRLVEVSGVPLTQLVDWKNRLAEPFRLRCEPLEGGQYRCEIDLPNPVKVQIAVPVVHGEFEKREDPETKSITYESRPGNTLGQLAGPDGRPAFGVAYDLTALDAEGRPVLKVYFGTAAAWFVKNEYHAKWNGVREVRQELEPHRPAPRAAPPEEDGLDMGSPTGGNVGPRQFPSRGGRGRGGGGGGQGGDGGRRRGRRGGRGRGGRGRSGGE